MTFNLLQAVGICASAWMVVALIGIQYRDSRRADGCNCGCHEKGADL